MRDATLEIRGMHGCTTRVKTLLEHEPGVREAEVSFTQGQARVRYNEYAVSIERLVEVIENAGFEVTERS